MMSYTIEEARRIIADAGFIARVSPNSLGLVVYEGDVDQPGTWTEISRIAIWNERVSSGSLHQFSA